MKPALPANAISLAGYSALIVDYDLSTPLPNRLFAIGSKHIKVIQGNWHLLTPRHTPQNSLYGHLSFALKYEGLELGVLKALFNIAPQNEIVNLINSYPTGSYSRRIWFLYEWLTGHRLPIANVTSGAYVNVLDNKLQYEGPVRKEQRYRVNNNMPGVPGFCPIIYKTKSLEQLVSQKLSDEAHKISEQYHPDILMRASSFLLLADSRASYVIEGERPSNTRVERWGRLIGYAGTNKLSISLLEDLQRVVIEDTRFVHTGLRHEGGFVGMHDRITSLPIPEHISAKAQDLPALMQGLLDTYELLKKSDYPKVLLAAVIAFGFVFIHPFEDGNGRLHRYLIHHVLAESGFAPQGMIFPVSSVILQNIDDYRRVLREYSRPRLKYIKWHSTLNNNVEVSNCTIDLYRYFDVTAQAKFLYQCVEHTVTNTLPAEIAYLHKYDAFVAYINASFDMPVRLVDLLVQFLNQNNGVLSKRARSKEFASLTETETADVEQRISAYLSYRACV